MNAMLLWFGGFLVGFGAGGILLNGWANVCIRAWRADRDEWNRRIGLLERQLKSQPDGTAQGEYNVLGGT